MIRFERGIDPLKKMDIGQHGIAPEVESFHILDPDFIGVDPVTGKSIPSPSRVIGSQLWEALENGSALSRNPRFIGVKFVTETIKGIPPGGIVRLKALEGTYIKYDKDSVKLPKWNSKGEVQ